MKRNHIDDDRWNIHEIHNKVTWAWYVRFNLKGIKVNKSFAFNPNKKNDKEEALAQAKSWRNDEWGSITHKGVSTETTTNLTLRTLLNEYLEKVTPLKKKSGNRC